jgi:peptidoglycan/xylan/chitin deacetylase (PgdA/CDA1 family)
VTCALIYHDIELPGDEDRYGFRGSTARRYKLDPARFAAHLDAIEAGGADVGLLWDGPQTALTFDDGGASMPMVAEALRHRGWRAHFFITTGMIGTRGFMTREEIAALADQGHDVGSHSHSHATYMGALHRAEIEDEWRRSREVLGEITGAAPLTAAVPGGFVSAAVVAEAARAGYTLLMTSLPSCRRHWHDGIQVHGRYTIWANTSAARAAAYSRGDPVARASLWVAWQAKAAPKRLSPRAYEVLRRRWAERGPQTRARDASRRWS